MGDYGYQRVPAAQDTVVLDWNQVFCHNFLFVPPDKVNEMIGAYQLNARAFHLSVVLAGLGSVREIAPLYVFAPSIDEGAITGLLSGRRSYGITYPPKVTLCPTGWWDFCSMSGPCRCELWTCHRAKRGSRRYINGPSSCKIFPCPPAAGGWTKYHRFIQRVANPGGLRRWTVSCNVWSRSH